MPEKNLKDNSHLFAFDNQISSQYGVICGIDEVGRGPLAGDVYAAAVILPKGCLIDGLDDSKKLNEKKRQELFSEITEKAIAYYVSTASVDEIDSINILNATMLAMKRAYGGLSVKPDCVLVDGNRKPELDTTCITVVKGDANSASIAAASILAKVSRDSYMEKIAFLYPKYFFEKHKGYGTALHYEMLSKYGISPVHRKSFLKNIVKNQINKITI